MGPAFMAKRWALILKSQEFIADSERILEDHRDGIAAVPLKP